MDLSGEYVWDGWTYITSCAASPTSLSRGTMLVWVKNENKRDIKYTISSTIFFYRHKRQNLFRRMQPTCNTWEVDQLDRWQMRELSKPLYSNLVPFVVYRTWLAAQINIIAKSLPELSTKSLVTLRLSIPCYNLLPWELSRQNSFITRGLLKTFGEAGRAR